MPAKRRRGHGGTSWRTVLATGAGLVLTTLLMRRVTRRDHDPEPVDDGRPGPSRLPLPDPYALPAGPEPEEPVVAPEYRDVNLRAVLPFGFGIVALLGVILVLVTGILWVVTGRPPSFLPPSAGLDDPPLAEPPAGVVEEPLPGQTLASVRATEAALLGGYGWVDRQAGVVRLPIERAMQLVVERGLPAPAGVGDERFRTYGNTIPLDSSSGRKLELRTP